MNIIKVSDTVKKILKEWNIEKYISDSAWVSQKEKKKEKKST